jgi:hypothetical protein
MAWAFGILCSRVVKAISMVLVLLLGSDSVGWLVTQVMQGGTVLSPSYRQHPIELFFFKDSLRL